MCARQVVGGLDHERLAPAAHARFDCSVRLVYRHKDVIRIVLTEARKVNQQAVLVRHREGDL